MRSNSGKDESRNNLHDPTLREHGTRQGALKSHAKLKAPADHRQGQKDTEPKRHQRTG
jgi:hypothetical protein